VSSPLSVKNVNEGSMDSYFSQLASQWDTDDHKVDRAHMTANKIKKLHFDSTERCIDFGSGTGLLGIQLKETFTQVHLVDNTKAMLREARDKLRLHNINNIQTHHLDGLSKLTGHYCAIVTLMTLHHVDNVSAFILDAYQRLTDKGVLVIADLVSEDGAFHQHNPAFNGHHGFDVIQLSQQLREIGFVVESAENDYQIWQNNFAQQQVAYPLFMLVAKKGRRSVTNKGALSANSR